MISIYKKASACAQQFWWFYLIVAILLEIGSIFFNAKSTLGAQLFLQITVLFFLHRNFLLGEVLASIWSPLQSGKPAGRRGFFWLTIVYLVVVAVLCIGAALLHKSADGRIFPILGQTYPTTFVTGMPSAVKPFRTATRTWNSAT